jgi:hypothetical protein
MLRFSDKRSCAVLYNSHGTPWFSNADGGSVGSDNRHLQNDACNRIRPAPARSNSPVGRETGKSGRRKSHAFRQEDVTHRFGALRHAFARQLLAECGREFRSQFPSPAAIAFCWRGELRSFCATAREHLRSGLSARSGPRPKAMLPIMEVVAHRRQSSVGPSVSIAPA